MVEEEIARQRALEALATIEWLILWKLYKSIALLINQMWIEKEFEILDKNWYLIEVNILFE